MIKSLKIKNFTLIDSLEIDLQRGFSVITGETGAGKSIILGALGMLLGQRADSKSVKEGTAKCIVEAEFDLSGYNLQSLFEENDLEYEGDECILRRELTNAGKSRAFINDSPVQLTTMRAIGEKLVDIHSQHQNLLLRDNSFQLSVVDIIAQDNDILSKYSVAFNAYRKAEKALEEMRRNAEESSTQEEFMRYQLQELEEAALNDPEEQEDLEQQAEMMNHTEDIKSALYTADGLFNGDNRSVLSDLHTIKSQLTGISTMMPQVAELSERLESCAIELDDIASEVSSVLERVDFDPREQERINERLNIIYSLQRKHHCESIGQLIALRDDYAAKLSLIDNSEEALREQQAEVEKHKAEATKIAAQLTKTRTKAAKAVEEEMRKRLIPLGIPNVRFEVHLSAEELNASGADNCEFYFSANTSTSPQPVAHVASGGEIARVMLSLKAMISNAVSMPTIIFDEIDTGVSGKVAEAMGIIMQQMGEADRQVISITHLPQIASRGIEHYKVQKSETGEGTRTSMRLLNHEERIQELAQMISGSTISEAALAQARELLGS